MEKSLQIKITELRLTREALVCASNLSQFNTLKERIYILEIEIKARAHNWRWNLPLELKSLLREAEKEDAQEQRIAHVKNILAKPSGWMV